MVFTRFSPREHPLEALLELQREFDRVFERPFGASLGLGHRGVYPPVNVFGKDDHVLVRAEMPGVAPERVHVDVQGNTLTISGERTADVPESGSFHRRERSHGRFSRSIELPEDLDLTGAEATCRNGMLTIQVPRKAEAKPRQINVRAA